MVQLSAFNTPQFDWTRSRMPRKSRPVGKVFQPEIAARAIVWAARHGRRELIVGWPAWYAIWADKFFPGFADRYLARTAIAGQQDIEPRDPRAADNLWKPVPGYAGAHGRFDAIAKNYSVHLWFAMHRWVLWLALIAAALLAALAWHRG